MWVTCTGGPEKLQVRLAASEMGRSLPFPWAPLWELAPLRDGGHVLQPHVRDEAAGLAVTGGGTWGHAGVHTQGDGEGPSRLRGGLTPPPALRKPYTTRQPSCIALSPDIAGTRDKYIFSLPCREVFSRHPSLAPLCPVLLPPLPSLPRGHVLHHV